MNALFSNIAGLTAAVFAVSLFDYLYAFKANSLGISLFWTTLIAGGLFAISRYFDLRDARALGREPTRLFPWWRSARSVQLGVQ